VLLYPLPIAAVRLIVSPAVSLPNAAVRLIANAAVTLPIAVVRLIVLTALPLLHNAELLICQVAVFDCS